MSPFTCSLFALAALLATAHGLCQTKHIGRQTKNTVDYEPIYFYPPGVEVHVDDNYCPPGMHVVGEDIIACNNDSYRPAPTMDGPEPGTWSPFTVRCDEYQCPNGGNVKVKQYCDYY